MEKKRKKGWERLGWLGIFLVAMGGKLKALLPLLKLGKFGGTIISMAISIGAYALLYPWSFALGLVIMIFIHEMGHVWAAKIKGLPVSAPSFIPFLGALITMKKQPSDAVTEAYIAFGGPLIGTLGALLCYGLAVWTGLEILYIIAGVGFFLNLFNLIPVHPLDGGRIVVAITRWLWVVGLIVGFYVVIKLQSILLGIFYMLFVWELWSTFFGKKKQKIHKAVIKTNVELSRFEGMLVPSENHRRQLTFEQYCQIASQKNFLEVHFPGIGPIAQIEELPWTAQEIWLVKTTPSSGNSNWIEMHLEISYIPAASVGGIQTEDTYYQVPPMTRWLFGFAYVGLAAFLAYMLLTTPKLLM